jgi:hypothetical protein
VRVRSFRRVWRLRVPLVLLADFAGPGRLISSLENESESVPRFRCYLFHLADMYVVRTVAMVMAIVVFLRIIA